MKPICSTHDRGDLLTYMFVLQLRSNKREISVHVGQQRGNREGDLHMFPRDLFKALLHEGTSHFHWRAKNLCETKFVTGEATGMRTQKRMMNNWWRWSLLSDIVTVAKWSYTEDLALSLLVYEQLLSRLAQAFVVCGAVE